jgi:hypothetical protein
MGRVAYIPAPSPLLPTLCHAHDSIQGALKIMKNKDLTGLWLRNILSMTEMEVFEITMDI